MLQRGLSRGLVLAAICASATGYAAQKPVPQRFHLIEATIDDIHAAMKAGQITCRGLVELYLKRIDAYDKAGPALNAVQNINPRALQDAERLDTVLKSSGPVGPLHCIPVLVKDQVETMDMPTTYGSAAFKDFVPNRDATIVVRLKKAGAIILGKTTMGEFAAGYVGSAFGIVRNAYDPSRHPSSSSGGTGSSIAANFAAVGIAEDTGGSIRGPAAVNSLVGLRPTVPLVSRFGMWPASPTRDTLGPVARTVRDAAILLDAIAGYDPNDLITAYAYGMVPPTYTAFLTTDGLKGARIGVIREPMDASTDPTSDDYRKVRAVTNKAIMELQRLGAELVDPLRLPSRAGAPGTNTGGAPPGAGAAVEEQAVNAYLAQHPNAPIKTFRELLLSGKVSAKRVLQMMDAVGRTPNDPRNLPALLASEELRQTWLKVMADNKLDAVVYATFDHQPDVIPPDILTEYSLRVGYPRGSNRSLSPSLGFPAITVPAGFTSDSLPVGLEFMGRPFAEATLFRFAFAFEQATKNRRPTPLTPPLRGEP
jgi:amidase